MSELCSLDPYEEQLLKVFDSHDNDRKGSLNKDGLLKLCETLQLQDKATELINALLEDQEATHVTFNDFKDALLKLLGNMQNRDDISIHSSPEREVSPKFVYGAKKYGRRSRPRCDESTPNKEHNENTMNKANGVFVHRSNSQSEVAHSKKRKHNVRLKRCTSFPGVNELQKPDNYFITSNINPDLVCTEDMLREAWKKLGVGEDGYLNQTELFVVCDAIGLNKLADSVIRRLSNKLVLDYNKKISFEELLEALQEDETWNEFLNSTPNDSDLELHDFSLNSASSYQNSKVLQHIKLDPDGTGYITADVIIDLWEHAGIITPKILLTDLGFKDRHINIQELSMVLEKEIKGLNELRIDYACNPHVALLHAFLALYQTEIVCLKNLLDQMQEEREKLKCDILEANNRASLLAQEVDDNVAKMELNTQKRVKLLEQRHAELLKEVTEQFSADKEHIAVVNQSLENKIQCLEGEEIKLKYELQNANKYVGTVEQENNELQTKISEFELSKESLKAKIDLLEVDKLKLKDLECEQVNKLKNKITELQLENTNLRDKHDELVSTVEVLSSENQVLKSKSQSLGNLEMSEDFDIICDNVGFGSKRRGDESPSKQLVALGLTDSQSRPRLGKVRKFHQSKPEVVQNHIESDECSFDGNISHGYNHSSFDNEQIVQLHSRIEYLEGLLSQHLIEASKTQIVIPVDKDLNDTGTSMLNALQNKLNDMFTTQINPDKWAILHQCFEENGDIFTCTEQLLNLKRENKELSEKCEDLESGMGLLRGEYEKCEDYWQNKLDDERKLFEQEQMQSSDNLNELLCKLAEFEDQYSKDNNRLPTIDESFNLEKQFTDLEQEYELYKESTFLQLEQQETEIEKLKQKLEIPHNESIIATVGENNVNTKKLLNLSNHVIESTDFYGADTLPFNFQQPSTIAIDNILSTPNCSYETKELNASTPNNLPSQPCDSYNIASTSNSKLSTNKSMPLKHRRTRQNERVVPHQRLQKRTYREMKCDTVDSNFETSNGIPEFNEYGNNESKCYINVSVLQHMESKKYHLEQRCKRLQLVIKQQHRYDEHLLHLSWQQYRSEVTELQNYIKYFKEKFDHQVRIASEQQERLARNDLLVKDLFVDNAYLIAKNQRLEQQCHMLTQSFSSNSV